MKCLLLLLLFFNSLYSKVVVPEIYPEIVEQLVCFKDDRFKVFYGGPVDNGSGVKWMAPVLFEDQNHKVRAVYEISFINCLPNQIDAKEVDVFYLKVSDIDLKFRNLLSEEYVIFSKLINNRDEKKKCVLVREVDVSNVYYPEIFMESVYSEFRETDKDSIVNYLQMKFKTKKGIKDLAPRKQIRSNEKRGGLVEQRTVLMELQGRRHSFRIDHYVLDDDPWKSYYVVANAVAEKCGPSSEDCAFLRIDSGCTSGQIYNDQSCDCLDQLHQGLLTLAQSDNHRSLLIHIPAHDGRGFGVAPKAETEIYKRGGCGRVNQTEMLDTVQAAKLLYRSNDYDIRTYEGCAKLLKLNQIHRVDLLTDNRKKVKDLNDSGIWVKRRNTYTHKEACLIHIEAKKNSEYYYAN